MCIDYATTKKNIFATGRTIAGWSRLHGLNAASVGVFLIGEYKTKRPDSGVHAEIVSALEADGFLARTDDDQEQAA
jgi:hypothetical protein